MFGLRVGASGMSGAHGPPAATVGVNIRVGRARQQAGSLRLALGPTASERRPPARRTGRNARHRGGRAGGRAVGSEITLDFAAKYTSSLRLSSLPRSEMTVTMAGARRGLKNDEAGIGDQNLNLRLPVEAAPQASVAAVSAL